MYVQCISSVDECVGISVRYACIDACYSFFSRGNKDDGIDHQKVNNITKTNVVGHSRSRCSDMSPDRRSSERQNK